MNSKPLDKLKRTIKKIPFLVILLVTLAVVLLPILPALTQQPVTVKVLIGAPWSSHLDAFCGGI